MLAYSGADLWREVVHFGTHLWRAFFAIGIGPSLLGSVVLLRRDWRLGGMFLLMFAVNAGFYIDYAVVDKDTMFLPTYLICALWIGVGTQWLLDWLHREDSAALQRWGLILLQGTLFATVALAVVWNLPLTDLSDDWSARLQGEAILALVEPNALIFGWWDTVPVIDYLQQVEGQRPDVKAINRFLISPEDMRLLIQREVVERPVYIDDPPTELSSVVRTQLVGPIYRLLPR